MKRLKKWLAAGLICLMCSSTVMSGTELTALAATTTTAKTTSTTAKKNTAVKKGWVTYSSKTKKYYKNGKHVTGLQKIGSKYYFFKSNGNLYKKTVKSNGKTYYINPEGVAYVYKYKSKWYTPNGKKISSSKALKYTTLISAEKIVNQITTSKMTKKQKLKACFDWTIKHYYATRRIFNNQTNWPELYANDYFESNRGGNCFSDACAFAYLAKALGYKNVYVCVDTNKIGPRGNGHSWAEIDGLVYDPLFAEAKGYYKYFGVSYRSFGLTAIRHVKL